MNEYICMYASSIFSVMANGIDDEEDEKKLRSK